MWASPTVVNATDYTSFLRAAGMQAAVLPDDSADITTSLALAQYTVNPVIAQAAPHLYVVAAYNWGADWLVNHAEDQLGQTFFRDLRGSKMYRILDPALGVPTSAGDGGTSVGLLNPERMRNMTFSELQLLKTPFGRRYLGIAQNFGDAPFGLS